MGFEENVQQQIARPEMEEVAAPNDAAVVEIPETSRGELFIFDTDFLPPTTKDAVAYLKSRKNTIKNEPNSKEAEMRQMSASFLRNQLESEADLDAIEDNDDDPPIPVDRSPIKLIFCINSKASAYSFLKNFV